jgi:hypothetical protein
VVSGSFRRAKEDMPYQNHVCKKQRTEIFESFFLYFIFIYIFAAAENSICSDGSLKGYTLNKVNKPLCPWAIEPLSL